MVGSAVRDDGPSVAAAAVGGRVTASERARLGAGFRTLWSASAISNLGDGVRLTALPLLAASLTRDPGQVAAVTAATWLPWLVFSLIGGAVVDRADRARLMRDAQALRFVVVVGLALAVVGGWASMPVLYLAAFLIGAGEVLVDTAAQALVPRLVARDDLERANGQVMAAQTTANDFIGPPVGGFMFALGPAIPFWADAASFGLGAVLLQRLRAFAPDERVPAASPTSVRADIGEGLRWLRGNPLLLALAIASGSVNFFTTFFDSLLVLYVLEILDLGPQGFGILLTGFAAGGLLGSLAASRVAAVIGRAYANAIAIAIVGVTVLGLGATSNALVAGALLFVTGFVAVIGNVVLVTLRQALVPERLLGRVTSAFRMLGYGTIPLGALAGGAVASAAGLRVPFYISGVVLLVIAGSLPRWVNRGTIEAAMSRDMTP